MRESKVKVCAELSTLGVDSVCMRMGRKCAYLVGSGNLINLLAYTFIIVFEDIGLDSVVDEI